MSSTDQLKIEYHPEISGPPRINSLSLGWGQCGNAQLNIEPPEDGYVTSPTLIPILEGEIVKQVAIGSNHSLILTHASLFSLGCSHSGPLGVVDEECMDTTGKLVPIVRIRDTAIVAVAVGVAHSLAILENGSLYSWGENSHGQLGRSDGCYSNPCPVPFPNKTAITQISCGENHCLALCKDGLLYSWGCNTFGQLGLGVAGPPATQPQQIRSVSSLCFSRIAAGGVHSFALTSSGALFGWGNNEHGQLGIGSNQQSQPFPYCCRALRTQHVKDIVCGLYHSAALTEDGGVFTFGAGNHGQLGHGVYLDEHLPRKILELMGSTVTQIACGRFHTLTFVPASGRVYAFGLGVYGQLGLGNTDKRCTPSAICCPLQRDAYLPVFLVAAGGDSSLVVLSNQQPSVDQRLSLCSQYSLDEQFVDKIFNSTNSAIPRLRLPADLELQIEAVFSSCSVWNGAFLTGDGSHNGCSSKNYGIDLDLARSSLEKLAQCSNIHAMQQIAFALEQGLLPSLSSDIPDVEALRVFLILPFMPSLRDPANYAKQQTIFGTVVLTLNKNASCVLDKWYLRVPKRHFKLYLGMFKSVVSHILGLPLAKNEDQMRTAGLAVSLDMMSKLYKLNEEAGELMLPCYDFYIHNIANTINIEADYWKYITSMGQAHTSPPFLFSYYPFIFDASAKTKLLHMDARIQMQAAINQAQILNMMAPYIDAHPLLILTISRDKIIQDTLTALQKHGNADLKKPLKVQFVNEEAIDEGGVRKEFFLLLLREVLDLKYGMFRYYEQSRLLWFSPQAFEEELMFHMIGMVCGLAIYNSTIIELPFPLALYKKLLGRKANLDDLRELDPQLGKSMQDLLDYEGDDVEDVFSLTFSITHEVYDAIITTDLIPKGKDIPVDSNNRIQFVNSYVEYIFNESVKSMFEAFNSGFHRVCGGRVLNFFHPTELQAMVVGNEEYDWEELEKSCEYKGEYYKDHPTIKLFWEVFRSLSHDKKKQFLLFLTGCDRIPIQGMKSLKMYMQPMNVSEEFLPVAHTCFNLLDLPRYTSKAKLKEKLLSAIQHTQGFGLA